MKEVTVKLYKFNELTEKVQQELIEKNRGHATEHNDWFEPIIEGFKEDMKDYSLEEIEIGFTGFYSQGDGACFHGDVYDTVGFAGDLKKEGYLPDDYDEETAYTLEISIIKTSNHYEHENTIAGNVEGDWANDHDLLENAVTKWARDKSRELYKSLEKYHDELTSDEYVIEYLEEQGEVFQENGKKL